MSSVDVDAECLRLTAEREPTGIRSSLIAVAFVVGLYRDHIGDPTLIACVGLRLLTLLHNHLVCRRVTVLGGRAALDAGLFRRLAFGQTASGAAWGAFVWLTRPAESWRHEDFLVALVLALTLPFSLVTMSHAPQGMRGFSAGVLLSLVLHVLFTGTMDLERGGLLVGIGVLAVVLTLYGRQLHRQSRSAVVAELYSRSLAARLVLANESLNQALERAVELATVDPLTHALNRRAFLERAEGLESALSRGEPAAAVIMFDLDHFKAVNDQYGHHVGDRVLARVVMVAFKETRGTDLVARWGGEEFVLLLPGTSMDGAVRVAERIRAGLWAAGDPTWPAGLRASASFGVASWTSGPVTAAIRAADEALYAAKARGRNRVERATLSP